MVVDNVYNRDIKNKLKTIAYQKADYLRKLADNPADVVVHNQQDFINVKHPELEGGSGHLMSGNLASTSFDLGIEPKMNSTGGGIVKHKKSRTKKLIDAVENTQPITEKALMASGITAAGKPRKVRVKKVGGNFDDVMRTVGDVVSSGAKIAAHAAPLLLGLGEKATEWNTLVANVRKEEGLSLTETLKYIKEHNLYTKKGKTGGSARLPLMDESVAANLRDVMPPTTQEVGNVKSLKHDGSHEMVIQPSSSSGYTTKRRGRPRL